MLGGAGGQSHARGGRRTARGGRAAEWCGRRVPPPAAGAASVPSAIRHYLGLFPVASRAAVPECPLIATTRVSEEPPLWASCKAQVVTPE